MAKKPKVEAAAYLYGAREALASEVRELYLRYWYTRTNTDTCIRTNPGAAQARAAVPECVNGARRPRQVVPTLVPYTGYTHTSTVYTSTLKPRALEP